MGRFDDIYAEHLCSSCVHRNDGKHTCTVCYDGNLFGNKYQAEWERFMRTTNRPDGMNSIENLKRDIYNLAGRMGLRVTFEDLSKDSVVMACNFYNISLPSHYCTLYINPLRTNSDTIPKMERRLINEFGSGSHAPRIMRTSLPKIIKVIFNDPATIVFWSDGTKTVVKAQEGDKFDPEKGLAMAISKKALGNEGSYYNEISKWIIGYGLVKYNEAIKEREAESQTDYSDVLEERESDSSEPSTPSLYW